MRTRMRGVIAICLVVFAILVGFTLFKLGVLNNKSPPIETLPPNETNTTTPSTSTIPGAWAYLVLDKVAGASDSYVELTEEEVDQLPALKTALQAFEGSNRTTYWYKTSEREALRAQKYIFDKHIAQYEGIGSLFKYQDEFYLVSVALP